MIQWQCHACGSPCHLGLLNIAGKGLELVLLEVSKKDILVRHRCYDESGTGEVSRLEQLGFTPEEDKAKKRELSPFVL